MTFNAGVLWDMDGVLVDTGDLHYQSWAGTLAGYRIPFSSDLFRRTFGMNNAGILEIVTGQKPSPELLAEISDRKESLFRASMHGKVKPMPGVVDWLRQLQAWGVGQAVASSAPPENIEAMVDELGIRPYFSVLFSGYDLPGKPDPATFLHAAHQLGVSPERCLVVEDAIPGVQAAKRAGMACIAVLTTNPREVLSQADIITDTLDHLPVDTIWRLIPKQ
jgi:HAD superfamily hydrolase (TIGR01509 family)